MQKKRRPKSRRYTAEVRTAPQFDALASAVRDQIVQVVVNQAPWAPGREEVAGVSIREIAEQLGRKPGSLYRHIEELVEVGLIREASTQASGGRDAQSYSAVGEVMELVTPGGTGPALDALCRYLERTAAHAGKESAAATRARAQGEPAENGSVSMFGWLDNAQRAKLRGLMAEVAEVFSRAERREGTKLIAATVFVRPVRLPGGGVAQEP